MTPPTIRTLDDAQQAVLYVEGCAGDPEVAHSAEDEIYAQMLGAIADGRIASACAPAICREVLKTRDIDFPRWCA